MVLFPLTLPHNSKHPGQVVRGVFGIKILHSHNFAQLREVCADKARMGFSATTPHVLLPFRASVVACLVRTTTPI